MWFVRRSNPPSTRMGARSSGCSDKLRRYALAPLIALALLQTIPAAWAQGG